MDRYFAPYVAAIFFAGVIRWGGDFGYWNRWAHCILPRVSGFGDRLRN